MILNCMSKSYQLNIDNKKPNILNKSDKSTVHQSFL